MPMIHRVVSNYCGEFTALNTAPNEAALRCRKLDLYRSMITVGNPSFLSWNDIRKHGMARAIYDSILEKIAIVAVNVQSDHFGMRRHPVFETYVSDKKRIVSYNLGMAFAKLYSEKLLGIPNLIHVEFLKKNKAVTLVQQAGNVRSKEPDLVGQTLDGRWHVVEAKGVSTSESALKSKINEAKGQIQQIAAIHGLPPATGTACATCIGPDRVFTRIEDPPSGESVSVELAEDAFYRTYYLPFLLAKPSLGTGVRRERIDGLDVEFFELRKAGRKVWIGLASEIVEAVSSGEVKLLQDFTRRLENSGLSERQSDRYSIGLDGFVVGYSDH